MSNKSYKTKELVNFYSTNRIDWASVYPSEKRIFLQTLQGLDLDILDVGCACGGMGRALNERFKVRSYTGVDINQDCIVKAPLVYPEGKYHCNDFYEDHSLFSEDYNVVLSMSCIDWNIETVKMFYQLFSKVRENGYMIFSCRLTDSERKTSGRQKINFTSTGSGNYEFAPYKLFTFPSIFSLISSLEKLGEVTACGYWGDIPDTVEGIAEKRAFYSVFALKKVSNDINEFVEFRLQGFDKFWNKN